MVTPLTIIRDTKRWKNYVEQRLLTHADALAGIAQQLDTLGALAPAEIALIRAELQTLTEGLETVVSGIAVIQDNLARTNERNRIDNWLLAQTFERLSIEPLKLHSPEYEVLSGEYGLLFSRRGSELLALLVKPDFVQDVEGSEPSELIFAVVENAIDAAFLIAPDAAGRPAIYPGQRLVDAIREHPVEALAWARARTLAARTMLAADNGQARKTVPFFEKLEDIVKKIDTIDFLSKKYASNRPDLDPAPPPFDQPDLLGSILPAQPKRRSVLFTQHCYYNFYYLARALRARGWDAHSITLEAPDSPQRAFYHGEDQTIYDPDPAIHRRLISEFLGKNADRFGIIHSYGVGTLSLFQLNHDRGPGHFGIPWDILELKRRGALIGYSHSGCLDSVSQSAFRAWSPTMCSNCIWEDNLTVCSDERNLAWGRKLTAIVDLFCTETDPPLDYKGAPQAFRPPLTFAVDPGIWRSDLQIPARYRRKRRPGELIVYHAMGNYQLRSRGGRNIKGTGAVIAAIEQLQAEGIDIRLDFVHDIPSLDNRFVQVQADIIVDQLNYGRYGALAREGMLLGKPVVGRVDKNDGNGRPATRCIQETPIVHADENSVVDVLRELARDPARRVAIGKASRQHAIDWWSADRLAARFEQVYDHVRDHGRPPAEEDVL